jgi:hypothetical protein
MMALCAAATPALAQQRPLVTQDPEPVGSGKMLIDVGVDYSKDAVFPLSGLTGNLTRYGTFDLSFGVSPVAEIQLSGGLHDQLKITARNPSAPLAYLLNATGPSTGDVEDGVIGAKVRLLHETKGRPSLAIRFSTRLPNSKHDSGLGQDTTDFAFGFLSGKTVSQWRVIGNLGFAILQDPVRDGIQNDVLTYGGSIARSLSRGLEVVGEVNGRLDTRNGTVPIGTEQRSSGRAGLRITRGEFRYDAGVILGLTSHDPTWGVTAGMTWTFDAFDIK